MDEIENENERKMETELPEEAMTEPESANETLPEEEPPEEPRHSRGGRFVGGFVAGAVVMAAVLAVAVFIERADSGTAAYSDEVLMDAATEEKIDTLAAYIQQNYYEDVDTEDLREGLFAGLFSNLDVYSEYYTEEGYQELLEENLQGTYSGIGIGLQQDAETMLVTVVRVYEDSPAEEAGVLVGDYVYQVDEYDATTMDLDEIVSHIRGEENTSVHLVVYRDGQELEFDIPRKSLNYETVTSDMLEDQVGYIEVTEFTASTGEQFEAALDDLLEQGMEALIVDLRYNTGGVFDVACEMVDDILPEGLIVYTEDRQGNRETVNSTDDRSLDIPLAVLVNGFSASASEIFAGAIQDREAGILVGTTTYGKGVVQTVRQLTDGSAVKLTTSRYFTPSGTCIQDIGITPDVELEYEFLGGEDDTYSYELDNQIQEAVRLLTEEMSR